MLLSNLLAALSVAALAHALTPAQWRSQSIYQVVTDRFARTDGSTTASCNLNNYCGGTWEGLVNHLDYIQDMGFTAVCPKRYSGDVNTLTSCPFANKN